MHMIDQQSAQHYAFKTRIFLFTWVVVTGLAWWTLDNFIDQNLARELHIFLQAWFASFSPIQLFGHKPLVNIDGQSYSAAGLAAAMLERETVQIIIKQFFIYVPVLTGLANGGFFYFLKKKESEAVEIQHQLNKWEGN